MEDDRPANMSNNPLVELARSLLPSSQGIEDHVPEKEEDEEDEEGAQLITFDPDAIPAAVVFRPRRPSPSTSTSDNMQGALTTGAEEDNPNRQGEAFPSSFLWLPLQTVRCCCS